MSRRNLFEKARDWLPARVQAAAGVSIAYRRGVDTLTLTAVPGRTVFASNVEGGAKIQWGDGDFLIVVADLVAFGVPRLGDEITLTLSDEAARFEVAEPSTGEPHWRFSDPQQKQFRVHCKWRKPRTE